MRGPRRSPRRVGSGMLAPRGQAWHRRIETSPCTSKAHWGGGGLGVGGRLVGGAGAGLTRLPGCRVAALGLATGILLVLLLLCLYRVLCPRNYGQPGAGPGRRRRGELPCDDYGYAPPETEIVPLVLRGHLMVSEGGARGHRGLGLPDASTSAHTMCVLCSHRTLNVWPATACCW